jgi:hypothetical protein
LAYFSHCRRVNDWYTLGYALQGSWSIQPSDGVYTLIKIAGFPSTRFSSITMRMVGFLEWVLELLIIRDVQKSPIVRVRLQGTDSDTEPDYLMLLNQLKLIFVFRKLYSNRKYPLRLFE